MAQNQMKSRRTTLKRDDLQAFRLTIPNFSHKKSIILNENHVSSFVSDKKQKEPSNDNHRAGLPEQLAKKLETIQ